MLVSLQCLSNLLVILKLIFRNLCELCLCPLKGLHSSNFVVDFASLQLLFQELIQKVDRVLQLYESPPTVYSQYCSPFRSSNISIAILQHQRLMIPWLLLSQPVALLPNLRLRAGCQIAYVLLAKMRVCYQYIFPSHRAPPQLMLQARRMLTSSKSAP